MGDVKKSSNIFKLGSVADEPGSTSICAAARKLANVSSYAACCIGDSWEWLRGDGGISVVVLLPTGRVPPLLLLLLFLLVCLRPLRLVARYSHSTPRRAHREQVGFSLLHLTLEAEQAWQLSRNLGPAVAPALVLGAEAASGEFVELIVYSSEQIGRRGVRCGGNTLRVGRLDTRSTNDGVSWE